MTDLDAGEPFQRWQWQIILAMEYQNTCSFPSCIIISVLIQMDDICESLIRHEAEKEDQLLQQLYPFLSISSIPSRIEEFESDQAEELSAQVPYDFSQKPAQQIVSHGLKPLLKDDSGHQEGLLGKRKLIKKCHSRDSDSSSQSFSQTNQTIRRRKRRREKESKKKPYPTKNFLPNFKTPHLQFLRKYLKMSVEKFYSLQFIKYLHKKDGISLEDYQRLYSMREFSEAFEAMFECKYLYRELLLSRSVVETKKNHMRKLHVFEEAFRLQVFSKIN